MPLSIDVQVSTERQSEVDLNSAQYQQWMQIAFEHIAELETESDSIQASLQQEAVIRLVDEAESQELNLAYRQKNKPTNVLSFSYDDLPDYLGDIVICVPIVESEAIAQNKVFQDHMTHMIVHGTLHLLGYDHEIDEEAALMESIEINILKRIGVDNPYEPI